MLSRDDFEIVQRDRCIPGLATLLDPEAFADALRAHLPEAGIASVEPVYVHYKPYTNCLVVFQLRTPESELLVYAKAYGSDAAVKLEKTRMLQNIAGPLGPGTLILESPHIGVYFFPVDHRLKGPRRLASPETRHSLLRELLGKSFDPSRTTFRHLRYKPERRYVACLETPDGPRALLKFYTPKRYRAAKSAARAFCSKTTPEIGRAPCFSDRHKVLAFDWLPGHLLSQTLLDPGMSLIDRGARVELTGEALARLHAQKPAALPTRSRGDETDRLAAQAATIAHLCPNLSAYAERLAQKLASLLQDIPEDTTATHGDFYDKQVLFTDGHPVILDLDEAGFGPRAMDLGLFLAHLERHALCGRLSVDEVGYFKDAFIRGYQLTGSAPSSLSIYLYAAIAVLHLAAEPFRYREPNWRQSIERTLDLAWEMLETAMSLHAPGHVGSSRG